MIAIFPVRLPALSLTHANSTTTKIPPLRGGGENLNPLVHARTTKIESAHSKVRTPRCALLIFFIHLFSAPVSIDMAQARINVSSKSVNRERRDRRDMPADFDGKGAPFFANAVSNAEEAISTFWNTSG